MDQKHISERIDFLRFFMIVGLVLLHYSQFEGADKLWPNNTNFETHPYASSITEFFEHLFKCSVPILSVISGYLFFNVATPSTAFFIRKFRDRARTVLLPMISWGCISIGIFLIIRWISPSSFLLDLSSYDVSNMSLVDLGNAIFGGTKLPITMQFWFLHDLLLTVLFSPFIAVLLRYLPTVSLACLFVIWMGNFHVPLFFRTDVFFFFYVGSFIRVKNLPLDTITPRIAWGLMAAFLALTALRTGLPHITPSGHWTQRTFGVSTRGLRLMSVIAFWGVAPFLLETWLGRQMLKVSGLAFFLHAIHWPMNQFFKFSLAEVITSTGDMAMLTIYFASSLFTIATALFVAYVLATLKPGLLSHLSGGRSISRRQSGGIADHRAAQSNREGAGEVRGPERTPLHREPRRIVMRRRIRTGAPNKKTLALRNVDAAPRVRVVGLKHAPQRIQVKIRFFALRV